MGKLSSAQKNFYKGIMKELEYDQSFIDRIDQCKTQKECDKLLEFARIDSIKKDMIEKSKENQSR